MISEYLKQQTDFQAKKHRSPLIDIWKYFVANGGAKSQGWKNGVNSGMDGCIGFAIVSIS